MNIAVKTHAATIARPDKDAPILTVNNTDEGAVLVLRAGTTITVDGADFSFAAEAVVTLPDLIPGEDYGVRLDADGKPFASLLGPKNPIDLGYIGGFHFAPSGNAEASGGGDGVPSINPNSLWDLGFRPACADPRGMTLVELGDGKCIWADIHLLGVDHRNGTSRCGVTIADGRDRPERPDGNGTCTKLDYATAVEIYAHHGKRLLGAEEFFAAAYGVKERCSRSDEPMKTGTLDDGAARFVSRFGLFDATGTMWQWGTDGHPDDPRPSIFGGSWIDGSNAGSRYAHLDCPAGLSCEFISARGACDHLGA